MRLHLRMTSTLVLVASALVVVPVLALSGFYAYAWYQDSLRIADAAPAFEPLEPLKPVLLSQPFGSRYCRYLLDFPPDSPLTDDNVAVLQSLNLLPQQNTLDVTVRTKRVTDASVRALASLRSVDLLDVTETAITDDGIARLQVQMPGVSVLKRDRVTPAHN
ncbi:MAG: hypothetical protein ACYC35_10185 [Pirellulales bacterium]